MKTTSSVRRTCLRVAALTGTGLILAILLIAVWSYASLTPEEQADQRYEYLMSYYRMTDIEALETWYVLQQFDLLWVAPPGFDPWLQTGLPEVLPFDWEEFPPDFNKGLVVEWVEDIPTYPITIIEDAETRERVFFNADGKEFYALPAPENYDPEWFVLQRYPDLYEGGYIEEEIEWLVGIYDPSRVQISVTLVTCEDLWDYLYYQAGGGEKQQGGGASDGGGTMKTSYGSNDLWLSIAGPATRTESNEVEVTIHVPAGLTSILEIYSFDGSTNETFAGAGDAWQIAVTDLDSAGTNEIAWVDTNLADVLIRYYVAGNADTDSDGDDLCDSREKYIYHTNPTNEDTDADGMADGWEQQYGLDPFTDDALEDPDGDGRTNIEEYNDPDSAYYVECIDGSSNPINMDTDGDGVSDGPIGNDGSITNGPDAFPEDACAWQDTDCDGLPDSLTCTNTPLTEDGDDDNDGLGDGSDDDTVIPIALAPLKFVEVQGVSATNAISGYSGMAVAGTFNGWSTSPNMTLVSNYVWEYRWFFTNDTGVEFKFAANGSWDTNWGDDDQSDTNLPIAGVAESSGANIVIGGSVYGEYRFRFHETSLAYSIEEAWPTFDVSSAGRMLPYAAGGSAAKGFGRIYGGIYFNHDTTNLYVGIAGLDPDDTGNAFLLFLDTDGTNGGVSTLRGLSDDPQAIGTCDNLHFSASGFTPNVGVLVGDRRYDGRNFPAATLASGSAFGQGVYSLATNGVSHFPGFSTNISGGFSQWGDRREVSHHPPNAGIEVRLSLANLGLTTGDTFRAAAIFTGGTSSTNRYLSGEAYGESAEGGFSGDNFGYSNVTLMGSPVYLSDLPAPATSGPPPFTDSDVMLQAFYWDVPHDPDDGIWYDTLRTQDLSRFTMVWLPSPCKGNANNGSNNTSMGYDPYDHYDIGTYNEKYSTETRFGSESELIDCVETLTSSGIVPIVDLVLNHMYGGWANEGASGSGRYNFQPSNHEIFEKPDLSGTNENRYFVPLTNGEPFHYEADFGGGAYPGVNHCHPYMRQGLENWGNWISSKVGYQGYRWDVAYHIDPWFISEFMDYGQMKDKFAVMEGWTHESDQSIREMETFLALTDYRAAMFDMPLHDKLEWMCNFPSTFDMEWLNSGGFSSIRAEWAVTFVENHDTIRAYGDPGQTKNGVQQDKELAYAYILLSEGLPCVFYHDYYEPPYVNTDTNSSGWQGTPLKELLDPLIAARTSYAAGPTTYLAVSNKQDLYIGHRNGQGSKPGCTLTINNSTITSLWNTVDVSAWYTNGTALIDFLDTNHTVTVSAGYVTLGASNRAYRVYVKQ